MSASNLELVRHILVETTFILQHTEQKSKEEFINDEVLCRAVVRSLEIIGEATKKLDDEFKSIHNHIEWKKIAGTRDKLIHDYSALITILFGISLKLKFTI
jgi:uncharacterized protein with HEPN domain